MSIQAGETVACVGESGSGKTTLANIVAGLDTANGGTVILDGRERSHRRGGKWAAPGEVGMVFQDPFSSLAPHMRIGDALAEPMRIAGMGDDTSRRSQVLERLEQVGLPRDAHQLLPHEFSGGQRQRICIARALMLNCKLLIADEPIAALDVSIQAQVVNLLIKLQADLGFSMLFISHDLRVVRYIADRMLVLYHGVVMEEGPTNQVVAAPANPYTEVLLSVLPGARNEGHESTARVVGDVEQLQADGCPFSAACPRRRELSSDQADACVTGFGAVRASRDGDRRTSCLWTEVAA